MDGRSVDFVVGSGPSGVACAAALLQRGRRVHMLDAGVQLEPDRARVVDRMRRLPPKQWDPQSLRQLREAQPRDVGLPDKLVYGSSYPYHGVDEHIGQVREGVGLRGSLALGGLSTVWGAAMLPCLEQDIEDWPVTREQLAPHYESVARIARPSVGRDDLYHLFPPYTEASGPMQLSRQAQSLWNRLERRRNTLRGAGIYFGRARLAIQTPRSPGEPGCVYCAMCMSGCPYGYIYSAASTVAELRQSSCFTYHSDVVVRSVREFRDHVVVSGHHLTTRAPFEWQAGRVYLAAGAIPTTGILLRSLLAYERPVLMKDSQYFLLPVILPGRVSDVRSEQLHALSQIFLELIDPSISRHAVHLQVYSYSDPIGMALRNAMGRFARPFEFLARELEGRLLLFQGFVHSADSSEIAVTLRRHSNGADESLLLKAVPHPRAKKVVRRVVRKLVAQAHTLGIIPLPIGLQVAEPGRSFHSGGTFPMRRNPAGFETDVWGRPPGWQRVHAVDATVLPSIPATTITFTVMANAHRIGWETAATA